MICSYCGKDAKSGKFSVYLPFVTQSISCNRKWCKFWRKISGKEKRMQNLQKSQFELFYRDFIKD